MLDQRALEALLQFDECKKAWRADPVLYARTRIGINPTRQQQHVLEAIAPPGAKVTVRAGHGVGKTTAAAIAIWWHLEVFEFCKIPCTAPTASQLHRVLWAELSKIMRRADEHAVKTKLEEAFWLSTLCKINQDLVGDRGAPNEWCALARTARADVPDALQGFHASDLEVTADDKIIKRSETSGALMFVIEEASGVPEPIFEVALGALTADDARLLMIGNPVRSTGYFADSHLKHRSLFTPIHLSGKESPLQPPDYRARLVRQYGEGSNVVRVRADGEFPSQDDDVLIPFELVEPCLYREAVGIGELVLGVDPARFGDDRTVLLIRRGNKVLGIYVHTKEDTMKTAGRIMALHEKMHFNRIAIDTIGIGSGVYDRCLELGAPVSAVNVAEAATMPARKPHSNYDPRAPRERFERHDMVPKLIRDYVWMETLTWFQEESPSLMFDPEDVDQVANANDLAAELCTVRYSFDSSGRVTIESKDEMKKRMVPPRSPDLADALCATFAPDNSNIWATLGA